MASTVALGAVAWWIAHQEPPRMPGSGAGLAWLGVGLLIITTSYALRGWRWHLVMRDSDVPHRLRDAFGLTLVGYMGNNVLPARGGELLKIGLLGARTSARRREVLGTVLVERLLDVAVLTALFALLTWAGVSGTPSGRSTASLAAGALLVAAVGLALYLRLRRSGRFERFAAAIRPVARASKLLAHPQGIPLAGLSLAIWSLEGLTFTMIARAVSVDLEPLSGLAVMVLASLAAAIPAAPGYVGTFDAGIVLGLKAAGVTGGEAVGVLLLARFVLFVPVTFVGLTVLMLSYGGLRDQPREPPGPSPATRELPGGEEQQSLSRRRSRIPGP